MRTSELAVSPQATAAPKRSAATKTAPHGFEALVGRAGAPKSTAHPVDARMRPPVSSGAAKPDPSAQALGALPDDVPPARAALLARRDFAVSGTDGRTAATEDGRSDDDERAAVEDEPEADADLNRVPAALVAPVNTLHPTSAESPRAERIDNGNRPVAADQLASSATGQGSATGPSQSGTVETEPSAAVASTDSTQSVRAETIDKDKTEEVKRPALAAVPADAAPSPTTPLGRARPLDEKSPSVATSEPLKRDVGAERDKDLPEAAEAAALGEDRPVPDRTAVPTPALPLTATPLAAAQLASAAPPSPFAASAIAPANEQVSGSRQADVTSDDEPSASDGSVHVGSPPAGQPAAKDRTSGDAAQAAVSIASASPSPPAMAASSNMDATGRPDTVPRAEPAPGPRTFTPTSPAREEASKSASENLAVASKPPMETIAGNAAAPLQAPTQAAEAPPLPPTVAVGAHTIVHRAGVTTRTLEISLNPSELGTLKATLRLAGGQLSIEIEAETPEAHNRLSADSDRIAASLRALGYEVDGVKIIQPGLAVPDPNRGSATPSFTSGDQMRGGADASGSEGGRAGGNGPGGNSDVQRQGERVASGPGAQADRGLYI